jgi:hypothetical protein
MASKYFIYLAGLSRAHRDDFQQAYLTAAREIGAGLPDGAMLIVNLVMDTPEGTPFRPVDRRPADRDEACDVIVALSQPTGDVAATTAALASCLADIMTSDVYEAEEIVELDRQDVTPGERSPGIKYVGRLSFHPDLPASAARRSWDLHVPLALKVHCGMDKYVRNWIVDHSRGRPAGGIAELSFPSLDAMLTRYFDSERGKEEIMQDISHFVERGTRFFTTEFVLRR